MTFKTAKDVSDVISVGDEAARIRSLNRARINQAANGMPPMTDDEAKKNGVKLNVNWLEMPILFANAKRQYTRAVYGMDQFFRIDIPTAPQEERIDWSLFIGQKINQCMKDSREYFFLNQNRIAALVGHGLAPQIWWDNECWKARFIALDDFRVPTDTELSFENLEWIAVRVPYTEGQLTEKVFGDYADKHWKKPAIAKILHNYRDKNYADLGNYTWVDNPEKVAELVKQNLGFYMSDAVPTIPLWHFYYKGEKKKGRGRCWYLCIIPDWNVVGDYDTKEFLYQSDEPHAEQLSEFLHCQFGDLSNTTPQTVYAIRALGYELFEPCFFSNLTLCRTIQHLWDMMNPWFKINDPAGRARPQVTEMGYCKVLPEGMSVVPNTERHQIDNNLVQLVMAQLKQRMTEASASYTQQADTGTAKEQTAYETAVKMSMVNAMMEGLLIMFFFQEQFNYREICRRFCLRRSQDEDAQKFQKACKEYGIPQKYVNSELWKITAEMPIGNGNPAMAISQAQQLLEMRPMFGPVAQQEILHEVAAIILNDPRKAARWVPLDEGAKTTDAQKQAENDFNTCMNGVPPRPVEGLSLIDQIETLLVLMAGKIYSIQRADNIGTPQEVQGLQTLWQHIGSLIEQLAQDEAQAERVKQYSDVLGKLGNEVKGFAQRLQEQQQQQQLDPEAMMNIQLKSMEAQAKMRDKEAATRQKLQHKEASFRQKEDHKSRELMAGQQRDSVAAGAEIARESVKAGAEIDRENLLAEAEAKRKEREEPAGVT